MWDALLNRVQKVIFLGESGCGKSEAAISLTLHWVQKNKTVHLFDMDQTKPLFRVRDKQRFFDDHKVLLHYEEQMADEPTLVGGVVPILADADTYVVMDVGGNDTGAKLVGGFSRLLKPKHHIVFYIINPSRPWSGDIFHIDCMLSAILRAARIKNVHFLANPTLGESTTSQEFLEGLETIIQMLSPYAPLEGALVQSSMLVQVRNEVNIPLIPICPQFKYT